MSVLLPKYEAEMEEYARHHGNWCQAGRLCVTIPRLKELGRKLDAAEKVMRAFETERAAGRFHCECEWAPDEYTTLVRRCVTHEALDVWADVARALDRYAAKPQNPDLSSSPEGTPND